MCHTGFTGGSVLKNSPANAGATGDLVLIPGLGRSPGEGNGNPLQYSYLGSPMDRERSLADYRSWGCKESNVSEHAWSLCQTLLL